MWAVKTVLLTMLILILAAPTLAQSPTATPTPTPFGSIPEAEIHNLVATSAAKTNELPSDISRPVNNQSVVQSVDLSQLFSYAKWLFSPNSARELLGRTLAPIGIQFFILFLITVIMIGVYLAVFVLAILIKVFWWIINNILRLIEAIPILG